MRIRLSKLALGDLDSIYSATVAKWGKEQADRYLGEIWAAFEKVVQTPERWRLRTELHPGCRICFTGRHAILYRIHEGRVEIARVLHDAMDFPRHIPGDFMGGT
jgi:toxin ParE1/3/4